MSALSDIEWTKSLEDGLSRALDRKGESTPPRLAEAIRYSALSDGKRIRPRLFLASATLVGLEPAQILPAALSLELIHCFTLIHDDLPCMDNDDFRRGKPSNHKVFGESMALLAGDALIPVATELFLECQVDSRFLLKGLKRFLGTIGPRGVIGGQAAEPLLENQSDLKLLQQVHAMKTGALFNAAILVPMDLRGIPDGSPEEKALSHFARAVGLAFQVADDLEDREFTKPTSILSHLSPKEAYQTTVDSLNLAVQSLEAQWGKASFHLKEFSNEIISKMENTMDH